jgi:Asp-tRNA(Asn)/Glu-tRNA(Gln) amidotransferase A subunit family amidase
MSLSDPQSSVTELSIADIQARFAQGLLTCTELTQRLLQRIERYDKQGPGLHALVTVSPYAIETARHKDREYRSNPAAVGPLHGIPVIVKDNYNTADLPRHCQLKEKSGTRLKRDSACYQPLRPIPCLRCRGWGKAATWGTTVSKRSGNSRPKKRVAGVVPSGA